MSSQGRVASYDDEYRDQGLLWHMGGLGAKYVEDRSCSLPQPAAILSSWELVTGLNNPKHRDSSYAWFLPCELVLHIGLRRIVWIVHGTMRNFAQEEQGSWSVLTKGRHNGRGWGCSPGGNDFEWFSTRGSCLSSTAYIPLRGIFVVVFGRQLQLRALTIMWNRLDARKP